MQIIYIFLKIFKNLKIIFYCPLYVPSTTAFSLATALAQIVKFLNLIILSILYSSVMNCNFNFISTARVWVDYLCQLITVLSELYLYRTGVLYYIELPFLRLRKWQVTPRLLLSLSYQLSFLPNVTSQQASEF